MRGFRRAYKQGEGEGEGEGEASVTGCIFCLQVDGPLTEGGGALVRGVGL